MKEISNSKLENLITFEKCELDETTKKALFYLKANTSDDYGHRGELYGNGKYIDAIANLISKCKSRRIIIGYRKVPKKFENPYHRFTELFLDKAEVEIWQEGEKMITVIILPKRNCIIPALLTPVKDEEKTVLLPQYTHLKKIPLFNIYIV